MSFLIDDELISLMLETEVGDEIPLHVVGGDDSLADPLVVEVEGDSLVSHVDLHPCDSVGELLDGTADVAPLGCFLLLYVVSVLEVACAVVIAEGVS